MADSATYPILLVLLLTAIAAVWDLCTGEIPNRLVLLGGVACVATTLVLPALAGGPYVLQALLAMAFGSALVSLVPGLLYRAGGIGGGDLKLLAVVGAALGPTLGLEAELYAFAAAILYAPARLIWEGKLGRTLKTIAVLAVRPLLPRRHRSAPVPHEELTALRFGPAIFVGTLMATLHHLGGAG